MPKHQTFIDYFTHEFMEELWYLQKLARGDIPKRVEADPWQTFFNVTQGLLSLAPIPGLPLAFLVSAESLQNLLDLAEKTFQTLKEVKDVADVGYQKAKEFLDSVSQAQACNTNIKGMLQQEGPMDLTAIRVLVELLGRGLAERYEDVLSNYLGDPPEKSQIPLARVMAKRLFAYLQNQPLLDSALSGDLLAQRTRLVNGVVLGNVDKSWRERLTAEAGHIMPRILKDMQKVELPLQDAPKQRLGRLKKFTAEGVIKRSAWYDDANQSYERTKTDWQILQGQAKQPKYGYAHLADPTQPLPEMKSVTGASNLLRTTRYYRAIGLTDIQAYLNSPPIKAARQAKKTSPDSFHDFLRANGHPTDLQAVCHADLTAIQDWSFANFSGVDFSGAHLSGDLSGTNFSEAYLVGVTTKDVISDINHPVNLSRTQLGFSDWRGAKLPKADLTQADLSLANFTGVDLTDIQSLGANWYKTDLTGAIQVDLLQEQAKQVEEAQKQCRARMQEMDERINDLEKTLSPMLARLDALEAQPSSTDANKTEKLEASIAQLQAQINTTANSAFQISCTAELQELHQRTGRLEEKMEQLTVQQKGMSQALTETRDFAEVKYQHTKQRQLEAEQRQLEIMALLKKEGSPTAASSPVAVDTPVFYDALPIKLAIKTDTGKLVVLPNINLKTDTVRSVREQLAKARQATLPQITLKFQGELLNDDTLLIADIPGFAKDQDNAPGSDTPTNLARSEAMARFVCFKSAVPVATSGSGFLAHRTPPPPPPPKPYSKPLDLPSGTVPNGH